MSTYFASFDDLRSARAFVNEVVLSGVRPDDASLVSRETSGAEESLGRVGDATAFVGREDDPDGEAPKKNSAELSTTVESRLAAGIDTTDKTRDVDSVDQSDESQALSEDMLEPPRMTSQSEHERDDISMALLTGFPTAVPLLDDVRDTEGPRQDQLIDALESTVLPNGLVMGGGAMATAAFDVISGAGDLMGFLLDEGVSTDSATEYCRALDDGKTLVAIGIAPGSVNEDAVEAIAERWGAKSAALFDAPRFYDGGYAA